MMKKGDGSSCVPKTGVKAAAIYVATQYDITNSYRETWSSAEDKLLTYLEKFNQFWMNLKFYLTLKYCRADL